MSAIGGLNFHDSHLCGYTLGPRQEVRLEVVLDPVGNPHRRERAVIRVGAIENFGAVRAFFEKAPSSAHGDRYVAAIARLEHLTRKALVLELEGIGSIEICSPKISLS